MKILFSLTIALCFLALTPACNPKEAKNPDPEEACFFQQNAFQQRVSWGAQPVVMYADITLTPDQVISVQKAINIWNDSFRTSLSGKDIFAFGGQLKEPRGWFEDRLNVISKTDVWQGKALEQAETLLNWDGSQATEADIRINGNLKFSDDDTVAGDEVDMVALIVHELGHVLGLGHISTTEYTVMAPKLAYGNGKRRTIGDIDVDALRCEY